MEGVLLVFTIVITFGLLATGLMMFLEVGFRQPMRAVHDRRPDGAREWPETDSSTSPLAVRRRAASGHGGSAWYPPPAESPQRRSAARAARSQRPHVA